MLRIIASKNAESTIAYFSEGLKREEYYSEGKERIGIFHGNALAQMGLSDGQEVETQAYERLLRNQHPLTGKALTPRTNKSGARVPGWDFNFHAPKSLTLLHALTGDERLLSAFRDSVNSTMREIEALATTRVRLKGSQSDRRTANFAWAEFIHFTARPAGENKIPDPHLHAHCYCFSGTWDNVEDRFKALKVRVIMEHAPFFEALFHSKLSRAINDLGFPVVRTRTGWEIFGMHDRDLIMAFSTRTAQIEKVAKELGITDLKEKAKLGATTRGKKRKDLSDDQLTAAWKRRLTPEQRESVAHTIKARGRAKLPHPISPGDCVDFADAKCFERNSVAKRDDFLAAAMRFGVGQVSLDDILREMDRRRIIERNLGGQDLLTTTDRLIEEIELIQRIRDGRGKLAPLVTGKLVIKRDYLTTEQREAVRHILTTSDQVISLRGVAGAGKTTLLCEVRDQIQLQGRRLFAFAPSSDAARVLRTEGFEGADTVAMLLASKALQEKVRGQVILIDEVGTIPIPDLAAIMEIAGTSSPVLVAGDSRQHPPVGRGDTLRMLEKYSGMPVASVRQISRQDEQIYREAVAALAEADLKTAFNHLDSINAIRQISDAGTRYSQLAADYIHCSNETGMAPLVVSPTHSEGREVTSSIRSLLKEKGCLKNEHLLTQYRQVQWEEAEKQISENYEPGMAIRFHQNAKGFCRGSRVIVAGVDSARRVWVSDAEGNRHALDLTSSEKFRVYEVGKIAVAEGDLLRITEGCKSSNNRRLNNGDMVRVKRVAKDGSIESENGIKLLEDFGLIDHGYCRTSHSSQGKTVKTVFIAQSAASFGAASREQFYVSVSRGKSEVRIYTDDRKKLQEAVGNTSRRMLALELTGLGDEIFMNGGLSGTEWAKRIELDRGRRQAELKSYVKKVLDDRKANPAEEKTSFTAYIEARRANITSDGKHRSKGQPQAPVKRQGKKGMTTLKRVEMRDSTQEKVAKPREEVERKNEARRPAVEGKQAARPKTRKESAVARAASALKAVKNHLSKVVKRTRNLEKSEAQAANRETRFGKVKATLDKIRGPKVQQAQAEQKAAPKPEPPKPKPPAPVIVRKR